MPSFLVTAGVTWESAPSGGKESSLLERIRHCVWLWWDTSLCRDFYRSVSPKVGEQFFPILYRMEAFSDVIMERDILHRPQLLRWTAVEWGMQKLLQGIEGIQASNDAERALRDILAGEGNDILGRGTAARVSFGEVAALRHRVARAFAEYRRGWSCLLEIDRLAEASGASPLELSTIDAIHDALVCRGAEYSAARVQVLAREALCSFEKAAQGIDAEACRLAGTVKQELERIETRTVQG